ncbi:MAG: Rab family GTPase [Promethearchaeota archaeon]
MSESEEFKWKIVILGDGSVGKTSLITWYTKRTFDTFYQPTLGAQFSIKELELSQNLLVKLYLWDIAGQVKFSFIRKMFYEQAKAALFVYDVTNPRSFDSISEWYADLTGTLGSDFPAALIANKIDLDSERVITSEDGFDKATDLELQYYETSAKTGQGVDDAFLNIALLLLDKMKGGDR